MMMTDATDEHLARRVQGGDAEAFRALYRAYLPRVYAYIAYRVGDAADAEDLTAEVFARIVEHIGRFEPRREGAFAAWLFRITHNAVAQFHRGARRWPLSLDALPDIASTARSPEGACADQERAERLRWAVGQLAPRRGEIVALRYFADLRNRDIAAVLRLDERTVASHLSRALDDLARLLAEPSGEAYEHEW
jgi:RNA polymerase sigma-70 factor (ECF subfamily)